MSVLEAAPDAPLLLRGAAEAILFLHIGGGTVGMVSGAVALAARKGGRLHSVSGTVFFAAMLTMATIGAVVSPFLRVPEMANVVAGAMTLYLIVTSWATVRRRDGGIGRVEIGGFVVALAVCAAGAGFIAVARNSPSGTIGNTPPQAFYVFLLVGGIAAGSDLKVILRGGIAGPARIARHLWRMCVALTIAAGSFFLGQQRIMPAYMQGSPLLFVPVFAPLALMAFWLIRVRFKRRHARPERAAISAA